MVAAVAQHSVVAVPAIWVVAEQDAGCAPTMLVGRAASELIAVLVVWVDTHVVGSMDDFDGSGSKEDGKGEPAKETPEVDRVSQT
jgi:hypothetical protein